MRAGPDPLTAALCSTYLLGPLTHMWPLQRSEHAPAPADRAPLSRPASVLVAVAPGDGGKPWAAAGRKGSAWPAVGFSSCLCDSCTGEEGKWLWRPAALHGHDFTSPAANPHWALTHSRIAGNTHTPSTSRWPGRAGTTLHLGAGCGGQGLGGAPAGAWALLSPSLPPLLWCQAGAVWCGLSGAVGSCASAVDLTHTQTHTCSVCFCPCPARRWADSAALCPRCTCRRSRR